MDIVTSSSVLAEVGYKNAKGFFNILGLSVGINIDKSTAIESDFYKYDIIYGDTLKFQSNFLSNSSNQGLKRGDRDFGVVILDEVDSMLIDGSNNLAKQSSSVFF